MIGTIIFAFAAGTFFGFLITALMVSGRKNWDK